MLSFVLPILDRIEDAVLNREVVGADVLAALYASLDRLAGSDLDRRVLTLIRVFRQTLTAYVSTDMDVRRGEIDEEERDRIGTLLLLSADTLRTVLTDLDPLTGGVNASDRSNVALAVVPDPTMLRWMMGALHNCGLEAHAAASHGEASRKLYDLPQLDLLVASVELPDGTGIKLASESRAKFRDLTIIFLGPPATQRLGALARFLSPPFSQSVFERAVKQTLS